MPPEANTDQNDKKTTKPGLVNIMDDAPLFAGLDDYVQVQTVKEKKSATKAVKVEEKGKKKKAAAGQTKRTTSDTRPKQRPAKAQKSQPPDPNAILLSVAEMCTLLKISRATLIRMDNSGKLPGRIKLGGSVRFHRETVDKWLQSLINSTPST